MIICRDCPGNIGICETLSENMIETERNGSISPKRYIIKTVQCKNCLKKFSLKFKQISILRRLTN